MNILYCDCFSGISGDMFLGALVDAGLPVEVLSEQFKKLDLPEFQDIRADKVQKGALAATQIRLIFDQHLYDSHGHNQHRHLGDISNLIENSGLSERIKQTSMLIFQKLAEAEARVHGTSIAEVHFHEVGAVDSILDIVGAAVGLEYFNIQAVNSSALPLGAGQVKTQHGLLPLPAPATLELLRSANAPVRSTKATVELVTPTGAAILSALAQFRQPDMKLAHVGIGAGQRDMEWPNILRIFIGESSEETDPYLEIETNIDDMNPQVYGPVMQSLFQAGALDVFFTPIFMKKNRPGTKLSVICRKSDEQPLCDILLRETTTLGVRVKSIWRHEAERVMQDIQTHYGSIPVKLKIIQGKVIQAVPEFDICLRLADEHNLPVLQIIKEAEAICIPNLPLKE